MNDILTVFDFENRFPTEEACFEYLVSLRWPNGFICPKCGHTEFYLIERRKLFQCKKCKHQASVTAGTIFHKLKQPLKTLFWAIFLIATNKKGISALELQRKLGINCYKTAWTLEHKIRKGMSTSGNFPLIGAVEADETYVGGQSKGKRGRGAENKSIVAVVVETDGVKMGRSYLQIIEHPNKEEIGGFLNKHVAKGTKITTDGFPSYGFLKEAFIHNPIIIKDPKKAGELLPKAHIIIANLKMWLRGTFNRYPVKHLQAYLDEFTFRFNRRWKLENIFDKLLTRCIQRTTITYAELSA